MSIDVVFALALASLVISVLSTLASFRQASGTNRSHEAHLFVSFSDRYNSPEMAMALRSLAQWHRQSGDRFAASWNDRYRNGEEGAVKLNSARRLVSRFYFDAARLFHAKLITKALARALIANNGLNIFYVICEPMNAAHDPHRVTNYSRTLRALLPRYGDGKIR